MYDSIFDSYADSFQGIYSNEYILKFDVDAVFSRPSAYMTFDDLGRCCR
jgi:hypothetical protein